MTMVELLEGDKERLIGDLENAALPDQAQAVLEKEMDRLLYEYNESEKQEICCIAATDMMQVCRMGLPLVDSVGENIVWTSGEEAKKRSITLPLCILAVGAAVLLFVWTASLALNSSSLIYKLLITVSSACFASGGFLLGQSFPKGQKSTGGRQKVENRVDAAAIYRTFRGIMQMVDQSIERTTAREQLLLQDKSSSGLLGEGEIRLFSDLLEALYSGDGENALDRLEDVRYFLHCNHIDAVDYNENNRDWFDILPSMTSATIRPALVSDGTLLRKGLAAGGA